MKRDDSRDFRQPDLPSIWWRGSPYAPCQPLQQERIAAVDGAGESGLVAGAVALLLAVPIRNTNPGR